MHEIAVESMNLESALRRAIEKGEFEVHYQPIVALSSGSVAGFEALVRWSHPERGYIPPSEFIPLAEETGLIIPIGRWVLFNACRQMRDWKDRFPEHKDMFLSVNLSPRQLSQPGLFEMVKKTIQRTKLPPGSLTLELTESMIMENPQVAIEFQARLKTLGVELSIDDFGTGYSSLSCLHQLTASCLKIDRSFVNRLETDGGGFEITRAIVMLAHNLSKKVVAEGVETQGQLDILKMLGCEYVQGYLLSKPMDAAMAEFLLGDGDALGGSWPTEEEEASYLEKLRA